MLEQEPRLDNNKTVKQVVEEAVQPIVDAMKPYNEVNAQSAEPDADIERSSKSRAGCRNIWTSMMRGRWTAGSIWRWTRCAARPAIRRSRSCRAANAVGWPCAACCSPSRIFCCSTNRPITWMPNRCSGWKGICSSIQAPSSPSPTIGISWTTSPAGFWNSIAATASPGRAITLPGWSRSSSAWRGGEGRDRRQKTLERELE